MSLLLPSVFDRFRAALGGGEIEPEPHPFATDEIARRHAREWLEWQEANHLHPATECMLTLRIKAAIREDRKARGRL